jgi:hypothetical protein
MTTLVAGATTDGDQATLFNGTTDVGTVPDSPSLSVTSSMALECFVKFPSFPGSTKKIAGKDGSYQLQVNSAGKVLWKLDNGANTVTVTSAATLALNTWYHVVGVWNNDYTGATQIGKTTTGATTTALPPDYIGGSTSGYENLKVARTQIFEKGRLDIVFADIIRFSANPYSQWEAAVVYADSAGEPGDLLAQSAGQLLGANVATRTWVQFPVSVVLYPGFCWLGVVGGTALTGASEYPVLLVGQDTTGGTHRSKNSVVSETSGWTIGSDAVDPFGATTTSNSVNLAVYGAYTPLARTGDEGHAVLYINGLEDATAAYTGGVADTVNPFEVAPGLAVAVDEVSVWNKKLSPLQTAMHYNAR